MNIALIRNGRGWSGLHSYSCCYRTGYFFWMWPPHCSKAKEKSSRKDLFKQTVNTALQIVKYPNPNIVNLYSKITGRHSFTKLDFNDAYISIALDEDSRVLSSTRIGVFWCIPDSFLELTLKTGIFLRTIEQLVQGLPMTAAHIDGILIPGKNME